MYKKKPRLDDAITAARRAVMGQRGGERQGVCMSVHLFNYVIELKDESGNSARFKVEAVPDRLTALAALFNESAPRLRILQPITVTILSGESIEVPQTRVRTL